jgi:putative glutamine amidotransferase
MKKKNILYPLLFAFFILISSFGFAANLPKSSKKPLIGVSGSMLASTKYLNYYFSYVSDYYIQAIAKAGGIPVIIPIVRDLSVIPDQIRGLDGLIMSGGADINPLKYQEEPTRTIGTIHPERDEFDYVLLRSALKNKIPILGICRGNQLLNVFHGGTLHQDIESAYTNASEHKQSGNHEFGTHTVLIEKGSWLSNVLGKDEIIVNSLHHQAVKDLAPGFKITATSKDGVVEGIERKKGSFCVGVQWHPEMMHSRDSEMLKLCNAFVKVCQDDMNIKSKVPTKTKLKK